MSDSSIINTTGEVKNGTENNSFSSPVSKKQNILATPESMKSSVGSD